MFKSRSRHVYTVYATLAVILAYFLCDPDLGIIQHLPIGATTVAVLLILAKGILYATAVHWTRKMVLDYIDLDAIFTKANETPTGAGLAAVAISIMVLAITMCFVLAPRG